VSLRLYNTLTRRVEEFVPIVAPRVTLYSCGPTVWNYAHIGNFRTFLFVDLLRRWLEASGYQVYHIMNLTDVDDRIIKEAGKQGITIEALVAPFITAFQEDRDYLRITPAHVFPRATEFVEPMVRLVGGLLANGTAYQSDDGSVYFAIGRFPAYGRLSRLDTRQLRTGASGRVSSDDYDKENAQDFVLWKAAKPEDEAVAAAWDAPFGRGRPGWHLECSAMALDLIGQRYGATVLDIHTGGVDLIFPHHEDEIAQSCAYTGEPEFARVWMHAEFLNVRGTKMSKRFGNITTPRDLKQDGVDPGAIRLLVYQTHYRQRLDLTDEALAAAREGSRRLGEFARRFHASAAGADGAGFAGAAERLTRDFSTALNDDLNAPRALAALFDFVTEGNRLLDQGEKPGPAALAAWKLADGVLDAATESKIVELRGTSVGTPARLWGTLTVTPGDTPPEEDPEAWAIEWARLRANAKRARDFATADRIRALLAQHGFEVRDRKDGSIEVARK
jgi:cysteinyl-tRNA synthetase